MDYWVVLKEAAQIVWRWKILWAFALFPSFFAQLASIFYQLIEPSLSFYPFLSQFKTVPLSFSKEPLFLIAGGLILIFIPITSFFCTSSIIGLIGDVKKKKFAKFASGLNYGFNFFFSLLTISLLLWSPFIAFLLFLAGLLFLPSLFAFAFRKFTLSNILMILGVAIFFLVSLLAFVFFNILFTFASRLVILEREKILASIKKAYLLIRKNLWKTGFFWLLITGISLLFFLFLYLFSSSLLFLFKWRIVYLIFTVLILFTIILLHGVFKSFELTSWTLFFSKLKEKGGIFSR